MTQLQKERSEIQKEKNDKKKKRETESGRITCNMKRRKDRIREI